MPPSPDLQQSMDIAPYMGNRHKDNPHLSGPNDVSRIMNMASRVKVTKPQASAHAPVNNCKHQVGKS